MVQQQVVEIPRISIGRMEITLVGDSPLISHALGFGKAWCGAAGLV